MKKALEVVVVLAVLAMGAYVARRVLAGRELAAHPPHADPASATGSDGESSSATRGVAGLPMIKLSRPAKPARRAAAVPPPVSP
jgi:hypothetical protein